MQIHSADYFSYSISLTIPFLINTNERLERRQGLVVRFTADTGAVGWGEIAPLPGLHSENLEDVRCTLDRMIPHIVGLEIKGLPDSWQQINFLRRHFPAYPSLFCGLEQAFLHLLAYNLPSISSVVCPQNSLVQVIPINGLLAGTLPEKLRQAEILQREGYTCLKLKVGRSTLHDDIQAVRAVREVIGSELQIRLDANRSWSLEQALQFAEAIYDTRPEYIEEPLRNTDEISLWAEQTGLSVALDESLQLLMDDDNIPERWLMPGIVAWIIKPSALGGISRTLRLADVAQEHGIITVLSSAFETGLSLSLYTGLAPCLNAGVAVPCGLDTYRWLEHDILATPFTVQAGQVDSIKIHRQSYCLSALLEH